MSTVQRIGAAVVAVIAVAALGLGSLRALGDADTFATYEVTRGRFVHRVQAEGVLIAERATTLTVPMGNYEPKKIAWLAEDGVEVEAGEVVIRFDPTDMRKELVTGEADRAKAESRVEQTSITQQTEIENLGRDAEMAELQLEHARTFQTTDAEIYSRNEIIESQIDQGLATKRREHAEESRLIRGELGTVELQLLDLEKRKAQLTIDNAQVGLSELEIRAPHAGIFVLSRERGEPPTVGQIAYPSMTIAEIPQLDQMMARLYVLEADAGGLEAGVLANVRLEAHPDFPLQGDVRRVAAVAKRRNRWSPVQYFEVEIALPVTDLERMKPGQRVRAELLLHDLDDVLAVPREAVFRGDSGDSIVYRVVGGEYEPVVVTRGPAALGRVVIESGLQPGDRVALQDPTRAAGPGPLPGAGTTPLTPTGTRP